VLPGAVVTLLILLPWLDRHPERDPRRRPIVMGLTILGVLGILALLTMGLRDRPASRRDEWPLRVLAGAAWADDTKCGRCHGPAGMADDLTVQTASRGPQWLEGHISDPEMIAPGLRPPPEDRHEQEVRAIAAFARRLREGPLPARPAPSLVRAAQVFARHCVRCHVIDGDGGGEGPDLSHAGRDHDAAWLHKWIDDPTAIKPDTEMPAFGSRLTPDELNAISVYLSQRR
jgi:mono/diheme cytochrome c family protein